ncbi:RNA pyrophosphohydrolase [Roseobacter sp. HKCCA0434]|uniref:RNA pyrophosphohydrolase n=1 Tax=Roseobacter sp. HKCCA0434 TaxID=3079297 RepID=UPI002905C154|nr:RNA pyrophosphohydrolase [Roseobacter sp. HKCCA0434]
MDVSALPYRPCVGVMLTDGRGRLFAGARVHGAAGAWQAPQGGIDDGETPEVAALRELEEEVGVRADQVSEIARTSDWQYYDLPVEIVPTRWGGKYRGQKQMWFLLRLDTDDAAIDIATEHPEFSDWAWMRPEVLLDEIVAFKRPVYEAVLTEFAPHLSGSAD